MAAIGLVALLIIVALLQGLIVKKIGFGPVSVEWSTDDRKTAQPDEPRPAEPTRDVEPTEDNPDIPVPTVAPAASTAPRTIPSTRTQPGEPVATIRLEPEHVAVGKFHAVIGTGFKPEAYVALYVGTELISYGRTDQSGQFKISYPPLPESDCRFKGAELSAVDYNNNVLATTILNVC
jgi:hypothetical protein